MGGAQLLSGDGRVYASGYYQIASVSGADLEWNLLSDMRVRASGAQKAQEVLVKGNECIGLSNSKYN